MAVEPVARLDSCDTCYWWVPLSGSRTCIQYAHDETMAGKKLSPGKCDQWLANLSMEESAWRLK